MAPGTFNPKYMLLDGVFELVVGAAIVIPVIAGVALSLFVVRKVLDDVALHVVLLTPKLFVPLTQLLPDTSTLAATFPFGSLSVTSTLSGYVSVGNILPNDIAFGLRFM
jgi:hypothetical protein